jgi:hypothetical protein
MQGMTLPDRFVPVISIVATGVSVTGNPHNLPRYRQAHKEQNDKYFQSSHEPLASELKKLGVMATIPKDNFSVSLQPKWTRHPHSNNVMQEQVMFIDRVAEETTPICFVATYELLKTLSPFIHNIEIAHRCIDRTSFVHSYLARHVADLASQALTNAISMTEVSCVSITIVDFLSATDCPPWNVVKVEETKNCDFRGQYQQSHQEFLTEIPTSKTSCEKRIKTYVESAFKRCYKGKRQTVYVFGPLALSEIAWAAFDSSSSTYEYRTVENRRRRLNELNR